MHRSGRRFGWWGVGLAVALAGCFSETGIGEDDGATTSAPGCTPGAHLCPCADGACDPGLTCSVSGGVCVALDCIVGTLECPCGASSQCDTGLVCTSAGYCAPEGAGTGSPATGGETMGDGPATLDATAGEASATAGDGTSGPEPMTSGAGPTTDPTATGPADTGPTTATDDSAGTCGGDCVACLACARDDNGPCGADDMDCAMDPNCSPAVNQLEYCESQPGERMCCPSVPANEAGEKLWVCLQVECGAVCHCLMGG